MLSTDRAKPGSTRILSPAAAKATGRPGKNDPFFTPQGANAFGRDVPAARIVLLDTGHPVLETDGDTIAEEMRRKIERHPLLVSLTNGSNLADQATLSCPPASLDPIDRRISKIVSLQGR